VTVLGRVVRSVPNGSASRSAGALPLHRGSIDRDLSVQARRIESVHRGWVVMWSTWHRTFTVFGYFAPVPLVLDEATPDALIKRMREVELRYGPDASPPSVSQPSTPSAGLASPHVIFERRVR